MLKPVNKYSNDTRTKHAELWLKLALAMLILCWMNGCVHLVVIPADKEVTWLDKGQKAPQSGYLVPKARMLEILDGLGKREVETRPK
tara:strand:+ start:290 stop:550 length:261 start_codon:yes stop_codon:yes gene_type:complete